MEYNKNSALGRFEAGGLEGYDDTMSYIPLLRSLVGSAERAAERRTYQREDTTIQRKVEDLKKAGLNPILAANSALSANNTSKSTTNDNTSGIASLISAIVSLL